MNEQNADAQAMLNKVVYEYLREQKRKRRIRWVWRFLLLILVVFLSYQLMITAAKRESDKRTAHVGLVDIDGAIFESQSGSADNFAKGLHKAYQNKEMQALIIRINSPGGSPVQADYMFNTLLHYKSQHPQIKTYAVCVDLCASAAYYVAAAADEIYANPSSMVGSIGVLYNGFGFVDSLQKLGVSRRLQTAGKNKAFLDPFSPPVEGQTQFLQTMLDEVHQQFIASVKQGRGARLQENDEIFSGLMWTGLQAKKLGLIDGFASAGQLARDIIKVPRLVDYTEKEGLFDRFAKGMGTAAVQQLPLSLGLKPGLQ
ncbi:MAG: S49 family peptidase [Legionellaceae bacterium]|nr:S49 family peptidase [Legionellaceae bacterium]